MEINKSQKTILLLELLVPIALLVLGVWQGLLQTFFRAGIISASTFAGLEYYQGLTLHGVVNAIVLTTFFAVAFGNALVIYYLKKPLHKGLQLTSVVLMLVGTVMAAWAILAGKASVLYTFYAPLMAHPAFYIGTALLIVGSWVAAASWIKPYLTWRKENRDKKTPLAVLGTLVNFLIWFMATIPVAYEVLVILLPWSLGWVSEINIMLTRVLFWFFGHPLVYFWLLPAYIMFYVFLPKVAGGKLYSDYAGRLVFMLFLIFSIPVGLHHQFAEPGISQNLKLLHSIFTFGVALPSLLTAFTIAASLEHAGVQNGARGLLNWMGRLPWWNKERWMFPYLISGLLIFIFGGATGIVNASYNMNNVVHNTGWLPGHFHLTVAGPVLLAIFLGTLQMAATLRGRTIQWPKLNMAVPYMWMAGLAFFSTGLMWGGLIGEPRRTNLGISYQNPDSPLYRPDWEITTAITAIGGTIMFIAALSYFAVLLKTLLAPKTAESRLEFPTSEAYHNEKNIGLVKNLTPWIVVAVIIILIAYIPTIQEALQNPAGGAPTYLPNNPVPVQP